MAESGDSKDPSGCPTSGDRPVPPLRQDDWTKLESDIWTKLCRGETADLRISDGTPATAQSPCQAAARLDTAHLVRAAFIETILLHEPWCSRLPRQGVSIVGARITGTLNLEYAQLRHSLRLDACHFEQDVKLFRLSTTQGLSFGGSHFDKRLDLMLTQIGRVLLLDRAEIKGELLARAAKIDGPIFMRGVRCYGAAILDGLECGARVMLHSEFECPIHLGRLGLCGRSVPPEPMQRSRFNADVNLSNARIGGRLDLSGVHVGGALKMDGIRVDAGLSMGSMVANGNQELHRAEFEGDVDLSYAHVARQLDMRGACFAQKLTMDGIEVGAQLLMESQPPFRSEFMVVSLSGAKISSTLSFAGALCKESLVMDGIKVGASLQMGAANSQKAEFKTVRMRNAHISRALDLHGATVGMLTACGENAACFRLDMSGITVDADLLMHSDEHHTTEFSSVELVAANIRGKLDLTAVRCHGKLDLSGITVGQHLRLHSEPQGKLQTCIHGELYLVSATIGGHLDLRGIRCDNRLDMRALSVGANLLMRSRDRCRTELDCVDLSRAQVGRQLDMSGALVSGAVDGYELRVGSDLLAQARHGMSTEFVNEFSLRKASVDGGVDFDSAICKAELRMDGIVVQSDIKLIGKAKFDKPITLTFADIAGGVHLCDIELKSLDLRGTRIRQDLRVGATEYDIPKWQDGDTWTSAAPTSVRSVAPTTQPHGQAGLR